LLLHAFLLGVLLFLLLLHMFLLRVLLLRVLLLLALAVLVHVFGWLIRLLMMVLGARFGIGLPLRSCLSFFFLVLVILL